jgi:hypothetical protein
MDYESYRGLGFGDLGAWCGFAPSAATDEGLMSGKVLAVPRPGADGSISWARSIAGHCSGRPTSFLLTQLIEVDCFQQFSRQREHCGTSTHSRKSYRTLGSPQVQDRGTRCHFNEFQPSESSWTARPPSTDIDPTSTAPNVDRLQPITRWFDTGCGPTKEEDAQGDKKLFGVPTAED